MHFDCTSHRFCCTVASFSAVHFEWIVVSWIVVSCFFSHFKGRAGMKVFCVNKKHTALIWVCKKQQCLTNTDNKGGKTTSVDAIFMILCDVCREGKEITTLHDICDICQGEVACMEVIMIMMKIIIIYPIKFRQFVHLSHQPRSPSTWHRERDIFLHNPV